MLEEDEKVYVKKIDWKNSVSRRIDGYFSSYAAKMAMGATRPYVDNIRYDRMIMKIDFFRKQKTTSPFPVGTRVTPYLWHNAMEEEGWYNWCDR